MSNPAPQLVQNLWNYCNILRDDEFKLTMSSVHDALFKPTLSLVPTLNAFRDCPQFPDATLDLFWD